MRISFGNRLYLRENFVASFGKIYRGPTPVKCGYYRTNIITLYSKVLTALPILGSFHKKYVRRSFGYASHIFWRRGECVATHYASRLNSKPPKIAKPPATLVQSDNVCSIPDC